MPPNSARPDTRAEPTPKRSTVRRRCRAALAVTAVAACFAIRAPAHATEETADAGTALDAGAADGSVTGAPDVDAAPMVQVAPSLAAVPAIQSSETAPPERKPGFQTTVTGSPVAPALPREDWAAAASVVFPSESPRAYDYSRLAPSAGPRCHRDPDRVVTSLRQPHAARLEPRPGSDLHRWRPSRHRRRRRRRCVDVATGGRREGGGLSGDDATGIRRSRSRRHHFDHHPNTRRGARPRARRRRLVRDRLRRRLRRRSRRPAAALSGGARLLRERRLPGSIQQRADQPRLRRRRRPPEQRHLGRERRSSRRAVTRGASDDRIRAHRVRSRGGAPGHNHQSGPSHALSHGPRSRTPALRVARRSRPRRTRICGGLRQRGAQSTARSRRGDSEVP